MLLVPKASAKCSFSSLSLVVMGEGRVLVPISILPAGYPTANATLLGWGGSDSFAETFLILRKEKTQVMAYFDTKSGSTVSPTNVVKPQMKIIPKLVQVVSFT